MISYELEIRIKKAKKYIRFRSNLKSPGWVPFNGQTIKVVGDQILYDKNVFKIWRSREIPKTIKTGSFNQDARGRWYINLVAEDEEVKVCVVGEIGIDLGLITTATDSNGVKLQTREYRKYEKKLAVAQRAKKKKRVKKIHSKIKNKRKDAIEKHTTQLARENKLIVVGDVSAKKLVKTKMAKSVLDNSWTLFKSRLTHKTIRYGGVYLEVNEAYTSKTCSTCEIRWEFPKGLKSLAIREYNCPGCGVRQDRDINAAKNILRIGRDSLQTMKIVGEESPTIIALAI